MAARSRRMRSMTAANSTWTPGGMRMPNCPASRTWAAARAARISALDGTQPTLRQSPPKSSPSTRATLAPSPAAPAAVTSPAVPAPITTRLYRGAGSGLTQSGGWTLASSRPLCSSLGSTSIAMSLPPCEKPSGPGPSGAGPGKGTVGSALLDLLQRRGGKVDAEAVAPDGDHPVRGQVQVGGELVVLVPLVALELCHVHVTRFRDRCRVP